MNLILRQTMKGSIYSYIGAILGFVNVVLLMPKLFSTAEIGLANVLVAISAFFGQLGTLGFINVTVKLFPHFRNKEKKHNGFLFLLLMVGSIGMLLCAIFYFIFKQDIIDRYAEDSFLLAEYIYLLLPFVFITMFYLLIDVYNRTLFNASFGIFVKEFLLRIANLAGIILFYLGIFNFKSFIIYYTIAFSLPAISIFLLLVYKKEISLKPDFSILNKKFVKELFSVALFGMFVGLSGAGVLQIDKILINDYVGLDLSGVYSITFFFGTMIIIPARSLMRITSIVIADAFKNNDNKKVNEVYKKSVNTLTLIGIAGFLLIWGNIDNIMQMLKPEYSQGKYVILFISLAFLFQMFAGCSNDILSCGKFYRQLSLMSFILVLLVVILNIILLPVLGIVGASIAFAAAYLIFFIIEFTFIKIKYGFQPYDLKFALLLIVGVITYFLSLLLPNFQNYIIDLIIRSSLIGILYFIPVYLLAGGIKNMLPIIHIQN